MSFQSQLKETEAEDNIYIFFSKQFEIYFSYSSEISINEPRYNEVLGITNDFLYSSDRTLTWQNLIIANKCCQSMGPSL